MAYVETALDRITVNSGSEAARVEMNDASLDSAIYASWARFFEPVFWNIAAIRFLTVRGDEPSRSAICLFVKPRIRSASTSFWRLVS